MLHHYNTEPGPRRKAQLEGGTHQHPKIGVGLGHGQEGGRDQDRDESQDPGIDQGDQIHDREITGTVTVGERVADKDPSQQTEEHDVPSHDHVRDIADQDQGTGMIIGDALTVATGLTVQDAFIIALRTRIGDRDQGHTIGEGAQDLAAGPTDVRIPQGTKGEGQEAAA